MDDSEKKKLGEEGERKVNAVLKKFLPDGEYHLIENVTLPSEKDGEEKSAQIDHVVVSKYGIFVIETKHWSPGSITRYAAKPPKQNDGHINALEQCLEIETDKFFPLYVFLSTGPRKENVPEGTIPLDKLIPEIKSKTTAIFDEDKVTEIFAQIESWRYAPGDQTDADHVARLKSKHNKPEESRLDREIKTTETNQPTDEIITEAETNQTEHHQTDAEHIARSKSKHNKPEQSKLDGEIKTAETDEEHKARSRIAKETETVKSSQTKNLIKNGGIIVIMLVLFSWTPFYFNSRWDISKIISPPKENVQTAIPNKGASTDAGTEVFRQQFMEQLAKYESEVEPKIEALRLREWASEKHDELQRLEADAIEDFAKSDYLSAREGLRQARELASEAEAEYDHRLAALKIEANEAFADDRAPAAEKAVGQALQLRPDDAEMLALQKRVSGLPEVLDLLRRAGVARNENRPEKEAAALQKVLALDPSRKGPQSRLAKLHGQLKQQRFSGAVRKAQAALDAGDLAAAANQLALAKTISPADKSLAPLQKRLRQAQTEKAFAAQISLGAQAKARDDWRVAATHFQRARQLKPGDKTAVENHDLAQRVVGVTQRLRQTSDREHRLGDKNVLASVSAYLREAESLTEISPGLKKIHAEVTRKAALYRIEVEVVVVSDNATYIVVRGEGQVGETSRRTIRLRPGERVFEGTRRGYKSKLVTVELVPGASAVEVVVICDEKI